MIKRGDEVRVKFFKERAYKRDFQYARIGTIELIQQDQVWVRFPTEPKPIRVFAMDVEKL